MIFFLRFSHFAPLPYHSDTTKLSRILNDPLTLTFERPSLFGQNP
jgi:hypothetical protein